MWAPSPVSVSAKMSIFCWFAGCLKCSDKNPQIKSKTPEKGIIANNLFHLDGLDQQILEGTGTNLRTIEVLRSIYNDESIDDSAEFECSQWLVRKRLAIRLDNAA